MFRFTQEPSSGSQNQCLGKITGMFPQPCLRPLLTPVFRMKNTSNYRNSRGVSILLINTGYKTDLYQPDAA